MKNVTQENYILVSAALASVIVAFLLNAAPVALPSIAKAFAMNNILQNWVDTIYLLSIAVFSIPCGKICEKFGLKKLLKLGIIIFTIGTLGSALSQNSYMLLFFRFILGMGSAVLNVSSIALLVTAIPSNKRGKALGIAVAAVYIGMALSPILGGSLVYNLGWQGLFYATIPVLIINYYLISKVTNEWKSDKNDKLDLTGTGLYGIGIILFVYGFTTILEPTGQILTILGILLLISFGIWELKIKNPIFEIKLFKNIRFTASNLACLISYFATFMVIYILNYHFQYILGMNSQTAGLYLIIPSALMAIMSLISGSLSDKIKGEKLTGTGLLIVSIAFLILCFLNETTPLYIILIAMFLQGIGYGLFSTPNTNLIMSTVPPEEVSKASASVSTMRLIGQTISLGILTTIFAIIMGNVPIVPEYYGLLMTSSQTACIIATILCVIATVISFLGLKQPNN
ncbi:MAG: MFS transporter [Methanobacteriaceae archaeon]|nr:MFS transporter [Methanobacteriaceae archaeon]